VRMRRQIRAGERACERARGQIRAGERACERANACV